MSIILKLKQQREQLRVALDAERELVEIYESLELIRIYLELLDGDHNPDPVRVPGTTVNLFGRNHFPADPKSAMDRIETEIRVNASLYLGPLLAQKQNNVYEPPFSRFRVAIESVRVQIERWLVLNDLCLEQKPRAGCSIPKLRREELTALAAS